IGDGRKTQFWDSAWMQGCRPRDVAPSLFEISKRKNRTLYEALHANTWIRDIDLQHPTFSAHHFAEFVQVWKETQQIHLRSGVQYEIAWKLTESKQYSASSAYHAQFLGASSPNFTELIWRAWAPPKCKFFSWLAIQNRLWMAD